MTSGTGSSVWSPLDIAGGPTGSDLVTVTGTATNNFATISSCITTTLEAGPHRLLYYVMAPSGQSGQGSSSLRIEFFSGPACQGDTLDTLFLFPGPSADDTWVPREAIITLSLRAASVRPHLSLSKGPTGTFAAHFDQFLINSNALPVTLQQFSID